MSADLITEQENIEPMQRLNKDLKAAARLMGIDQVRWLVDRYYQLQEFRKAAANQSRSEVEDETPRQVPDWVSDNMKRMEGNIKIALREFADAYKVGQWMMSIVGIGPVIASGLLCSLDIRRAKTAGAFHAFAGYNPEAEWYSAARAKEIVKTVVPDGNAKLTNDQIIRVAAAARVRVEKVWKNLRFLQKLDEDDVPDTSVEKVSSALALRPWNAALHRLCFLASDCFVKFQNHKDDTYGKLFAQRKEYERRKNMKGDYADQCRESLEEKAFGADTDARAWYEGRMTTEAAVAYWNLPTEKRLGAVKKLAGEKGCGVPMLPPARLQLRAQRWAAKIFLSHVHHAMHVDFYGVEPPVPYAFNMAGENHSHFIPLPNWPWEGDGKGLRELLEGRK